MTILGIIHSFLLRYLTIFPARHAVSVTEEAGQCDAARDAGKFANDGDGIVGRLQQTGDVLQTLAVDEAGDGLAA